MNILGLIVEYNPFHNGHLYHLEKSKKITKATHTIAVMSGSFLQRGEPALFDKYTRAEIAVKNGVDLVIELPTLYSCQSAEIFSHGAITTLNSLNCVDSVCFGSEEGSIDVLKIISKILVEEPIDFKTYLKKYLDEGLVFPTARSKALYDYINENNILNISENKLQNILNSSNNILGIEYIKSLIKLNSSIKPFTISRIASQYNSSDINSNICSATAIRNVLKDNLNLQQIENVVPNPTFVDIKNNMNANFNPVFDYMFYDLLSSTIVRDYENLEKYFEVNEGIENKIYSNIFTSKNLDDLISSIKSKRYTMTKVKRTLNNILLGITKDDVISTKDICSIPYIRVLAFNDKGREIIRQIKKSSDIEIITKLSKISHISDPLFNTLIKYDIKSSNMYNLIYYKNNKSLIKGPMDFYFSPRYVL
ncbi:nucleotidyltransferase [Terrisporobacter sp.]|uniref:nucleotidyltransferase n=1 Tax=Terrisporobacter sp. TaxID=1965305 RepID=UPI0026349414|nr:nucleotidyltransferase [Terrisporobacter sp.]